MMRTLMVSVLVQRKDYFAKLQGGALRTVVASASASRQGRQQARQHVEACVGKRVEVLQQRISCGFTRGWRVLQCVTLDVCSVAM